MSKFPDFSKNLENPKISKILKILIFEIFRFSRFVFHFFSKFHKKYFSKNIFKLLFRRDEKIFLLRIFFYDLDCTSRLPQTYSEHSVVFGHASPMNKVQGLPPKIEGNQWIQWENNAFMYELCVELLMNYDGEKSYRPNF